MALSKLARKQMIARKLADSISNSPRTPTISRMSDKAAKSKIISGAAPQGKFFRRQGSLEKKAAIARDNGGDFMKYAEVRRIIDLPIVLPMDEFELEEFNRQTILADQFEDGWRLFPIQSEALMAYQANAGGFFPIGVGWGKTLISLMVANEAYQKGLKKIMLFIPSGVLTQLTSTDIGWARTKVPINMPIHVMGGKNTRYRRMLAKSQKKGLYILPYSCLSTKDTSENLKWIQPELIIADEAHNLKNPSSARTRRVRDFVDEFRPEFVAMSGTITSKTIKDYYHIIKWALKQGNPLPNSAHMASDWSVIIDAHATGKIGDNVEAPSATGPLLPLITWAQKHFPQQYFPDNIPGFRKAYKVRLNSASGVASSGDADIGTSLIMANQPVQDHKQIEGWNKLKGYMDEVLDEWMTPNGDEIDHAIHTYKWMYELTAGFYNELVWPGAEKYAQRKGISFDQATSILDRARKYHSLGQIYASALRKWLESDAKPGMDTPLLVGNNMSRHGDQFVGEDLYELWSSWKDANFEGRPDRDSHAIRICPYKINAVVDWAANLDRGVGGIIWVYHQEMGRWACEALRDVDLNPLHCPAGDQYDSLIADPANTTRIIVASLGSHGQGKNLQHFSEQYFLQWPRNPIAAEQGLGRTHRNGQKADELTVHTNNTIEFDRLNFAACLNDALYIHQTTGNRQKLIYASYNPMPSIFPAAVLQEKGYQNKILNSEQRKIMEEKFGASA